VLCWGGGGGGRFIHIHKRFWCVHSVHVEQCDEMSMRGLSFKLGIIVLQYVHRVAVVLRFGLDICQDGCVAV